MSEEIFSSTGSLGTDIRQDNRLYCNAEFSDDPIEHRQRFENLVVEARTRPEDISRVVLRGIVSDEVAEAVMSGDLSADLEVALPLHEFGHRGWLLYLARNRAGRDPLVEPEQMIAATAEYRPSSSPPLGRIQSLTSDQKSMRTDIRPEDCEELERLWGPVFGWNGSEIRNLARRLDEQQADEPSERSVWFAATRIGGLMVSAAMGERLTLPGADGPVDLVENTEWCTHNDETYRNHGLVTATLAAVNAQAIHDLTSQGGIAPIIYAECNFSSRSDRAGHGAGLRIPSRQYATQILRQNVVVNDGLEPVGLRDFSFMYLPPSMLAEYYDRSQIDGIMELLATGVRT